MVNCCVIGCKNRSERKLEIVNFHKLPTKPELREKWLKIINRPDWTPHKYSTVCSKHFEPKCFVQRGRRIVLIKDSIPTLFVPLKLKQRTATVYISPMVQTQALANSSLDKKFYQNTIQQLRSNLQTRQNLMTARKQQTYEVRRKVQTSAQPVNNDSKGKIIACCACLTTDARFAFLGNKMMQAFLELVGAPFTSTDVDLPQYFCALCRTELSKFVAFRDRCQRASELLRTLNEFEALTSDDISAIDRDRYKLTHNLNKVNVYHFNSNGVHYFSPIHIKREDEEPTLKFNDKNSGLETLEDKNECKNLEILEDKLNDTDNGKETFDTDSNDTENEAVVEYLDYMEDEKEEILKESFIYIGDGEQEGLEDFNDTGYKTKENINKVFNNDEHVENETLDEEEIEESKLEYIEMEFSDDAPIDKNIYSMIKQTENIAVEKSPHPLSTKRKAFKTEVDYPNFDCAAFERRYQVKITVLEKEEQLKEIDDRKKESSYLKAAYKCELCGKGFKTEKPFRNHMTYHDERTGRFLCEVCNFRFPVQQRLLQHRKMHRVKYTCLQCGFVSRGRAFATRHREVHLGKKYSCMHCSRSFTRRSTCYNHARIYHARDNIACDQCGETFLSMRGVRLHKSRAHREKLEPKPEFKCPICQANFETSKARDKHESTATIVEHMTLNPCAVCGENCESAATLSEHTALKHSSDQFRCEECDKTFSNAASFDTHTARKHREPLRRRARSASPRRTKVCCEICGRFVTRPGQKELPAEDIQTAERKRGRIGLRRTAPYFPPRGRDKRSCRPKTYRPDRSEAGNPIFPAENETVLRQHQITHAADKPFKCPLCSRGFAVKHARNFHIRTHTGERPFQCEQCPLAFALHSNLRRHHRVVHLGQRRSFPCELCGKTFTTRYSVKLHVNTVHNGLPWPKRDRTKRKTKK